MSKGLSVEYRVRPVTRYVVTRFHDNEGKTGGSEVKGEFDNESIAYDVAYALCKDEHQRLGYPPSDERITYPKRPAGDEENIITLSKLDGLYLVAWRDRLYSLEERDDGLFFAEMPGTGGKFISSDKSKAPTEAGAD